MAPIPINSGASFERGVASDPECERLILGSILLDCSRFGEVAAILKAEDFAIHKHAILYSTIADMMDRGEPVDRCTLSSELDRKRQLETVDGLGYIVSLDDGLPRIVQLEAYCKIVLNKSRLRTLSAIAQTLNAAAIEGITRPEEILSRHQDKLKDIQERIDADAGGNGPLDPAGVIAAAGGFNEFMDPSQRTGIKTGYGRFDEMTGGFSPGQLIIIAGRPAMGKTALAMNIAANVARQNKTVLVFSLEMGSASLLHRMMCAEARVDSQLFRSGMLDNEGREKLRNGLNKILEWPLHIDERGGISVEAMGSVARKLSPALIVVDYLQLMSTDAENRTQEVSKLSRELKLLAKDLGCPILVLSQLSRKVEERADKKPQLQDLRESGSIEQDADLVAFVFREEYYHPDKVECHGEAELIIAKQREGPTGTFKLTWIKQYTKFENLAESYYHPPE